MVKRFLIAALAVCALAQLATAQVMQPGASGPGYYAIYQGYPNNALTGTTLETNQAAIRIPANTLGTSGTLRITAQWTFTNSANNKTFRIRLSATSADTSAGALLGNSVQTTNSSAQGMLIVRNAGATNSQVAYQSFLAPFGVSTNANTTGAIDTTADCFVNINGVLALGTETMTLLGYTVETIRQ